MRRCSLFFIILFLPFLVYSQSIITVNNAESGYDYSDLQEAINVANEGDIIMVYASGEFYGSLFGDIKIDKKLTIIGEGYFSENVPERITNSKVRRMRFDDGSSGSIIKGLHVNDLKINAPNIAVSKCLLTNLIYINEDNLNLSQSVVNGNIVSDGVITQNHIINNNLFLYITQKPLGDIQSSVVYNNTFSFNYSNNDRPDINFYNNIRILPEFDVDTNKYPYLPNTPVDIQDGFGNYSTYTLQEVFVWGESTDRKFQLREGSPAISFGLDGQDSGAFGGDTPYVISGTPSIPRITNLTVPQNASPGTPLQVSFTIKGN